MARISRSLGQTEEFGFQGRHPFRQIFIFFLQARRADPM